MLEFLNGVPPCEARCDGDEPHKTGRHVKQPQCPPSSNNSSLKFGSQSVYEFFDLSSSPSTLVVNSETLRSACTEYELCQPGDSGWY